MTSCLSLICPAIQGTHLFGPEGGTFGRSNKCDWSLPDPERILSSIHARIVCQGDTYFLIDESTNGTFLAGEAVPIGRSRSVAIADGMIFVAGRYQIEARLVATAQPAIRSASREPSASNPHYPETHRIQPASVQHNPAVRTEDRLDVTRKTLGASLPGKQSLDPLDYLGGGSLPEQEFAPADLTSLPYEQSTPDQVQGVPSDFTHQNGPRTATANAAPLNTAGQKGANEDRLSADRLFSSLPAGTPAGETTIRNPLGQSPSRDSAGATFPGLNPISDSIQTAAPAAGLLPSAKLPNTGNIIPEDFLERLTDKSPGPMPPALKPAEHSTQETAQVSKRPIRSLVTPGSELASPAPGNIPGAMEVPKKPLPDRPLMGEPRPPVELSPGLKADHIDIQTPLQKPASATRVPKSSLGVDPLEALKARREQRIAALDEKARGAQLRPPAKATGAPSPPAQSTRSVTTPAAPPLPSTAEAPLVAAMLKGLGFSNASVTPDSHEQLMTDVGAMAREMAEGMVTLLSARKLVKSEFRMDETQIQPEENNPYKFFKVGELALDEMLISRSGGFLTPEEATKAAFEDIQNHTITMMSAMQRAMKLLFDRVAPEALAQDEEAGSGLRIRGLGGRKGKWDVATDNYDKMRGNFEPLIRQIIMEAFAQVEEERARRQSKEFWEKRKQ